MKIHFGRRSRRAGRQTGRWTGISVCAIAAAGTLAFGIAAHADALVVKTDGGKVHGKLINNSAVRTFQGIPYAAPPIGDLRWKAPQAAIPWKGELDASHYGRQCAQRRVFEDMVFLGGTGPTDPGSEDCLSLNIYTPADVKTKAKLPVMFWIHGGGYQGGSGGEPRHNGDFLPGKGVILVTINYRLGVFGFLALPELAAEQGGSSGDYGLMDMVAALNWVKKNIASFGGDPANITIFGESAGSASVSTLMAAPSAQGLFQKAIGESGAALSSGLSPRPLADVEPSEDEWMKSTGAQSLADLRALPMDRILEFAGRPGSPNFGPVVDGKFLTEPVVDTYLAGHQAHIPLLAGFNHDEGSSFAKGITADKWRQMASDRRPDRAELLLKLYPATTDAEAVSSAIDFGGDQFISFGTWKWIEIQRRTGQSVVYRYKFDLPAPPSRFHKTSEAFHSDDIEYVFGSIDTRPDAVWRPEDRKLSDQMMSYWTNFAKTGDPNGPGLPEWPKYGEGDPVQHLDNPITTRPDEYRARYEFWLDSENK